jgi:hypothetical protein
MIDPKVIEQAAQCSSMLNHPVAQGTMLAASGLAASRLLPPLPGLAGLTLLRNPLVLLAGGIAAGYLLHKYEKEIIQFLARASGMGKDFVLHQRENLEDLLAEAQEKEAAATPAAFTDTAPQA